MKVTVIFCDIEEVGELQPPKLIRTTSRVFELEPIPKHGDLLDWENKRYYVYDIIHKLEYTKGRVEVTALHSVGRTRQGLIR
jgi:hypothetical protein